jgi:hypothetical protein
MARRRKDRETADSPSVLQPDQQIEEDAKDQPVKDMRPGHREETRGTRGPRFGYWQVGGASRSAIKRLKKP